MITNTFSIYSKYGRSGGFYFAKNQTIAKDSIKNKKMETIIKFDRKILKDLQEGFCRALIVSSVLLLFLLLCLGFRKTSIFIALFVFGVTAFLLFLIWVHAWVKLTICSGPQLTISKAGVKFKDKDFYGWDEILSYRVSRITTESTETGPGTITRLIFEFKNGSTENINLSYFEFEKSADEIVRICDEYKND